MGLGEGTNQWKSDKAQVFIFKDLQQFLWTSLRHWDEFQVLRFFHIQPVRTPGMIDSPSCLTPVSNQLWEVCNGRTISCGTLAEEETNLPQIALERVTTTRQQMILCKSFPPKAGLFPSPPNWFSCCQSHSCPLYLPYHNQRDHVILSLKPFEFLSVPWEQVHPSYSSSVQLLSRIQFCNPMECSTPGLPVHHQLPEFTQTHVRQLGDAIQPSHLLSSPSPAFNLSLYQGLFQWVRSSHQVAKVLEFQLQHQSFQWIFRTDLFKDGLVGSPCSSSDSQESSPTPQFKCINSLALSVLHSPTLTSIHDHWKNHSLD